MLIVNADDFGLSHSVNMAVIRAFEQGLCTSCSVMPNMPGFEQACDLARAHGLTGRLGLHLTLTQGGPVTGSIRKFSRFCDPAGRFRFSRRQRVLRLSRGLREALKEEIEGQIAACCDHGLVLTHMDSHNHAHEEWAITSLVLNAARDAGIPCVRLCKTYGRGLSAAKCLYRRIANVRIRAAGLAATHYFGDPYDCLLFCREHGPLEGTGTLWEVMIHPAFNERGQLVDSWLKRPLEDVVRPLFQYVPPGCIGSARCRGPVEPSLEMNRNA